MRTINAVKLARHAGSSLRRGRRVIRNLALLWCATFLVVEARSVIITLNPTKDGFMYVNAPTQTGDGFSGEGNLDTYYDGSQPAMHDLAQFDLSSLSGATINSATLSFYLRSARANAGNADTFEVYRVTTPWDVNGKFSWNYNSQNTDSSPTIFTSWSNAGGDFTGTGAAQTFANPYATTSPPTTPADSPVTWDVKTLVQGWVDGSYANNGLMFIQADGVNNAQWFFYGVNSVNPLTRPTLAIDFTAAAAVPEPCVVGLLAIGGALACWRRRR